MSNKIWKVTVMILISTLILVEVAPRLQLLAANEDDLATTEITIDNGTDDPDQAESDDMPAETVKPVQTAKPAQDKTKQKVPGRKDSSSDSKAHKTSGQTKHDKKKTPAQPTPVPTYRPIEGRVLLHNAGYMTEIQQLKKENKKITGKRSALITKTQSLTVRQAYLKKMRRVIGNSTMAVKVAATGTAVSRVVSSAAVQGFDSTVDQVVYQGYILCNPNYFDVLSVSGMDAFFEENDTIDLGTYLDKEMSECEQKLDRLKRPVHKIRKKFEKIHSRYVKGMKQHNPVIFNPYDLTVKSYATVPQMRKMLKGSEMVTLAPVFVKAEHKYGVNAVGLASIAALESAWGTSRRAREDHNLTGFGVSADDAEGINAFSDQANIMRTARWLAKSYLAQEGIYHTGNGLSDINKYYSASYEWAWKVEHCAQQMFEKLGD